MILTVYYMSSVFLQCYIVWLCKSKQDALSSKEVSIVLVLYISLSFHLFFLSHPSFQSYTNVNLFEGKMHVPGNCLPHSAISIHDIVPPVVLLLVYLNLDIWTQNMFKQTGKNCFSGSFAIQK